MAGMDCLIAEILRKNIETNLGKKTIRQIENRLFEKYGITLTESMNDFSKFDKVLQEFFGSGSKGMIRSMLNNLCKMKKISGKKDVLVTVHNPNLTETILEMLGDSDYRKILDELIGKSRTTYEILDNLDMPKTSAYRKIEMLVNAGLLVENGKVEGDSGRPAVILTTLYRGLDVKIIKNKIKVQILLSRNMLEKSTIIGTMYNLGL